MTGLEDDSVAAVGATALTPRAPRWITDTPCFWVATRLTDLIVVNALGCWCAAERDTVGKSITRRVDQASRHARWRRRPWSNSTSRRAERRQREVSRLDRLINKAIADVQTVVMTSRSVHADTVAKVAKM
jgi:hypothetical protein